MLLLNINIKQVKMAEHYDNMFKIILAGDTSVGKTNLVQRFSKSSPVDQKNNTIAPTIGVQFSTRIVQLENRKRIKAQIWDTAGQEQYRSITTAHYRRAVGALVVYDITKQKTFHNVKRWIESIREQADANIVIFLVGNKIDQRDKQQVNPADARKFANNEQIFFEETSALTNYNVEETFQKLIGQIYKSKSQRQALTQTGPIGSPLKDTYHDNKCQC